MEWAITEKLYEYLYGAEIQVFTDNKSLMYVLAIASLDATCHILVAAL